MIQFALTVYQSSGVCCALFLTSQQKSLGALIRSGARFGFLDLTWTLRDATETRTGRAKIAQESF
jgi:hypothetical protein